PTRARAARDAALDDPPRGDAPPLARGRDDPPGRAGLLPPAAVDRRPRRVRRAEGFRPARGAARPDPPLGLGTAARTGLRGRLRATLEMIRFSHSVFALPFALLSLVVASGGVPALAVLGWVLLAMVAARSAAMAFNRVADRRFDAENPRTAKRHLVTGELSVGFAVVFTVVACAIFVLAAAMLNRTALLLAAPVLVVVLGYSYLKRVTPL